jgi:ribosome-binding protein aMBF1 (putative translation factor)
MTATPAVVRRYPSTDDAPPSDVEASDAREQGVRGMMQRGDFCEWLRSALAIRRMSQRMLAARSGIDHSTISRIVSGEREPTLRTAQLLAAALGAPLELPTIRLERLHVVALGVRPSPGPIDGLVRSSYAARGG